MPERSYQEKPPNICKGCSSHLQIDEIAEDNGGNCECDAFDPEVVGEGLGAEDHAGSADASAIESLKEVSTSPIKSRSPSKVKRHLRDGDLQSNTHARRPALLGVRPIRPANGATSAASAMRGTAADH